MFASANAAFKMNVVNHEVIWNAIENSIKGYDQTSYATVFGQLIGAIGQYCLKNGVSPEELGQYKFNNDELGKVRKCGELSIFGERFL